MAEHSTSGRVTYENSTLRYLGAGLAFLVAALHLFHPDWGFVMLALILTFESPLSHLLHDPRPVAFVVSALAIIIGINLVLVGFPRKPIYLLGMLLLVTYFVGYFAWHLTGHGGLLPGREPHYHGLAPLEAVVAHMQEDVWARVAKLAEALLFCVLALLYHRES